jgi:hypothetical protein
MATYKFPEFNVEITNPIIVIEKVNDLLQEKMCNVDVVFIVNLARYVHTFCNFNYVNTWEDADIEQWINNVELPKYII